jgi:hypothetical protein
VAVGPRRILHGDLKADPAAVENAARKNAPRLLVGSLEAAQKPPPRGAYNGSSELCDRAECPKAARAKQSAAHRRRCRTGTVSDQRGDSEAGARPENDHWSARSCLAPPSVRTSCHPSASRDARLSLLHGINRKDAKRVMALHRVVKW